MSAIQSQINPSSEARLVTARSQPALSFSYPPAPSSAAPSAHSTSSLAPPHAKEEFSSPQSSAMEPSKPYPFSLLTLPPLSRSPPPLPPALEAKPLLDRSLSGLSHIGSSLNRITAGYRPTQSAGQWDLVQGADPALEGRASPPWNDRLPLHRELSIRAKFFNEPLSLSPLSPGTVTGAGLDRMDSFGSASSLSPLPFSSPALLSSASLSSLNTEGEYASLQVGDANPLSLSFESAPPVAIAPLPLTADSDQDPDLTCHEDGAETEAEPDGESDHCDGEADPSDRLHTDLAVPGALTDDGTDTDSEPALPHEAIEPEVECPPPKRVRVSRSPTRRTKAPSPSRRSPSFAAMAASSAAYRPPNQDPANDDRVMIGTLTQRQRNEALRIYREKRSKRNFSRVVYECRKTFANIRPRVAGRFVKIDHDHPVPAPTVGRKRALAFTESYSTPTHSSSIHQPAFPFQSATSSSFSSLPHAEPLYTA